ncbi:MAG: enoyl-CoA hydratase-related protein [Pseudomonadota bacterium]|nr:enoyl-CoA hydratase-related protein [Pseudomonadota bacterium]
MSGEVTVEVSGGIAHLTLNRPDKRNALNRATIDALSAVLERCRADSTVRMLHLSGAGNVFCAGADLGEMQAQAHAPEHENLAHAERLAHLLGTLDAFPKPTLARINGDGYGGALGLIAACDIAIVASHANFAFTEVRLGIIPAVVSPFVLSRISESAARRYFLTAETLNAATLKEVGLAHEVVQAGSLDMACIRISSAILKGAPEALREAKALIRDVAHAQADLRAQTALQMAARLARLRVQGEAQEGFSAFFEKRKPNWRTD